MSAFLGIDIAGRALRTFEMALKVTGHNLANIETRGYSRQGLQIEQTPALTLYALKPLTLGTGAYAHSVNRIRDIFLEGRFRETSYEQSRYGQLAATLRDIESVFSEPGTNGIQQSMIAMFDSWNRLSADPSDEAARLNVRMQASMFAQRMREAHSELMTQQQYAYDETKNVIHSINDIAARISKLNEDILRFYAVGATPNDLLDQRDVLLEDLSKLVDFRTQEMPNGVMAVFIHQHSLVDQTGAKYLPTDFDPATGTLTDGIKSIQIRGGRLSGLLGGLYSYENHINRLNALASGIRDAVNALHVTGINLNGNTGVEFFTGVNGASDLQVSDDIIADLKNIAAGTSGEPGDGTLALAISQLRSTSLTGLGDRSPLAYYSDIISRLGQDINFYQNQFDIKTAASAQLDAQRQAVSGVNMDEELANLTKYQRSYQAAAKLLSVFDQITAELIEKLGR